MWCPLFSSLLFLDIYVLPHASRLNYIWMIDHQILLFLKWVLAIVLNISLLVLPSYSNSRLQKQKPSREKMKTRSMSNKPDQADDQKKNEGPQAGRRTTRQAANRTSQHIEPRQTGNAATRGGRAEPAAGSRAIGQRGRGGERQRGRGGERRGMLARSGLVQDAGGDPDNNIFRVARREMAPAPRPRTRGSMAHQQLHRSNITATSVAPTEVMSGSGYVTRQTQAEVINNGGSTQENPAQEKKRIKGDWASRSRSVRRRFPGHSVLRLRTSSRVFAIQNDLQLQQRPRERVRREIPQGPQPMSIDQLSQRIEGRTNYESRGQQEVAQFNIQGRLQDTDARVVPNKVVVEDYVEDENRSRLSSDSMPIQTNINEEFRARIFDYLRSIQERAEVEQETYLLSKKLVDRYCSVAEISEENWQLLAVTAMFVASKYEEVWPPKVTEFGGRRFLLSEVIRTEQAMLRALDYKITIPTPADYIRRFIKVVDSGQEAWHGIILPYLSLKSEFLLLFKFCFLTNLYISPQEKNLAFYLANLSLRVLEMRYSPAFIAAAAVYAARYRLRDAPAWTNKLEHHTGYTEREIKDSALLMLHDQK